MLNPGDEEQMTSPGQDDIRSNEAPIGDAIRQTGFDRLEHVNQREPPELPNRSNSATTRPRRPEADFEAMTFSGAR